METSSKKDGKRRRRAKALAERAERFERHAALVAERSDDPQYAQRTRNADGSYSISLPPEAVEMIRQQEGRFREKFGHDMGPNDPVFFDPDADEPIPISVDRYNEIFREVAEGIDDPDLRAMALASTDVGYMVTEENQHLFTAHEVEAFGVAVSRRRKEEAENGDIAGFMTEQLQHVVQLLAEGAARPELPRFMLDRMLDESEKLPDDDFGPIIALMVVLPLKWVVAAKSLIDESDLNDAVNWIAENFGAAEYAGPASVVAAAMRGGEASDGLKRRLGKSGDLTVNDLHDILGQDFGPAMMWLCAGLLATVGEGDPEWLLGLDQAEDED